MSFCLSSWQKLVELNQYRLLLSYFTLNCDEDNKMLLSVSKVYLPFLVWFACNFKITKTTNLRVSLFWRMFLDMTVYILRFYFLLHFRTIILTLPLAYFVSRITFVSSYPLPGYILRQNKMYYKMNVIFVYTYLGSLYFLFLFQ